MHFIHAPYEVLNHFKNIQGRVNNNVETLGNMATLYQILNVRTKITDEQYRMFYLRYVWGLEQNDIAECEGVSQSKVSYALKKPLGHNDIKELVTISFNVNEIKYLHMLPRKIINDAQLVSFVNNILGLNILHPFYAAFQYGENIRIAALSTLGIRQKHLMKLFDKSQPAISQIVKRHSVNANQIEQPLRDDIDSSVFTIEFEPPKQSLKFIVFGGNNQ